MSVRVVLMRHGHREQRAGDPPLTEQGRREAARAAEGLHAAGVLPAAVYASPLARARETGEIVASHFGLAVREAPLLLERANWDDEAMWSFDAFVEVWKRASVEREWVPPVGESARSAGERLGRFVRDALLEHRGETVVAATHGGVIGDFLVNAIGSDELVSMCAPYDPAFGPHFAECSVTICEWDGQRLSVECVADTTHLKGPADVPADD